MVERQKDFFDVLAFKLKRKMLEAVSGEEELVDEVMAQFAETFLEVGEHEKIRKIQKADPHKFNVIISNIALDSFEDTSVFFGVFSDFLATVHSAYSQHIANKAANSEFTQG